MMGNETKAAQAYLNEAMPQAEPWSYDDAREWLINEPGREARALRAALRAIGIMGGSGIATGQDGEAD